MFRNTQKVFVSQRRNVLFLSFLWVLCSALLIILQPMVARAADIKVEWDATKSHVTMSGGCFDSGCKDRKVFRKSDLDEANGWGGSNAVVNPPEAGWEVWISRDGASKDFSYLTAARGDTSVRDNCKVIVLYVSKALNTIRDQASNNAYCSAWNETGMEWKINNYDASDTTQNEAGDIDIEPPSKISNRDLAEGLNTLLEEKVAACGSNTRCADAAIDNWIDAVNKCEGDSTESGKLNQDDFTECLSKETGIAKKKIAPLVKAVFEDDKNKTTCNVDGIGWIVCPVMNFIAKINDEAFSLISGMLTVEPRLLQDKDTKAAWEAFRNIANIAFVIAFLFIIYSQMTGLGVTNYGIKRLLPKLIIAAVLVNVSYYVCQIAVDISNIIGSSIYSFFKDIPTTAGGSAEASLSWVSVIAIAIAGAAALILAASVIGGAAVLAFALVILILVARQAILILLVVISPLAFVAYLLPNTEQWFKKWWSLFSKLLMLFPVIGVIFGASFLAARIVANGGDPLMQLTALGIMAVPLFAVPIALKGAMAATGALGSKLNGWQDRAMGAAGKKSKERYGNSAFARGRALRKQGREEFKNRRFAEAVSGDDTSLVGRFRRRSARGITNGRTIRPDGAGAFSQQRMEESAIAKVTAAEAEVIKNQQTQVANAVHGLKGTATTQTGYSHAPGSGVGSYSTRTGSVGYLQNQFHEAIQGGDATQARAALQALKESGEGGVEAIQETLAHHAGAGSFGGDTQASLRGFINESHSDLKGNDARITNWAGDGNAASISNTDFSGLTDEQIASQTRAALTNANSTGEANYTARRTHVAAAIDAGTIKAKAGKRALF